MTAGPVPRESGPVLGLIPAKGGSTRLPRKNVLPLGGRPLMAWAAEAARASGVIDRLVVSTEDEEVAAIALDLGLDVPFRRPVELARDPAGVVDVALHALAELAAAGHEYRTLVLMTPTCPFVTAEDVRAAFELFVTRHASFLMSVSPFPHTPFAALRLDGEGFLSPCFPEYIGRKSQQMPPAVRCNGALHVLDVEAFRRERSYYAQPLVGYVMPLERSVDIDTAADLEEAELRLVKQERLR